MRARGLAPGRPAGPAPGEAPETQAPDARYRFLSRFGATILAGGIAAIPTSLYHYQAELGLVPQEVWFVGYILAHRWTDALPYPSLRQMSRRAGISTQMLHRYKQSLVEKGYLATIPRHRASGGRTSNFYDFSGLFARLEALLRRDRRGLAWQPTADEAESGPEAECETAPAFEAPAPPPPPAQRVPPEGAAVPASHHDSPAAPVKWEDVIAWGRQRALTGGDQRHPSGGRAAASTGAPLPASPAPVIPAAPLETRSPEAQREAQTQRQRDGAQHGPHHPDAPIARHAENEAQNRGVWAEAVAPRNETRKRALPNAFPPVTTDLGDRAGEAAPAPNAAMETGEVTADSAPGEPRAARTPGKRMMRGAPDAGSAGSDPAAARWAAVCDALAREITPAAMNAWLRPLTPVALVPAPASDSAAPGPADAPDSSPAPSGPDVNANDVASTRPDRHAGERGERLVLACVSAFQRDHVLRRYRVAIEAAAGAACELVVRPAPAPAPVSDGHAP